MDQQLVKRVVLIGVLFAISCLFLWIIRPFLMPIFLAALFAALFTPLYSRLLGALAGREALASFLTLLVGLLFVFVPLLLVAGIAINQAADVAESAMPWIQQNFQQPSDIPGLLERLPFYDLLLPYRDMALERVGELTGQISGAAVGMLRSATLGTFNALLMFVIMLYTMFFFLMDGDRLLYWMLYYLPLPDEDETRLLNRFTSVTRATLKGTAVIGFLQGGLAGLALWVGGVPSALFWSVAMMLLSVVPGVGSALVWIPAVIYIGISHSLIMALGVAVFCVLVVGSIDNVLRPRLVGNDVQLHELLIFFGTLGGLLTFGFMGFVIGPIIAALFVTIWELYGDEFSDWLPTTAFTPRRGGIRHGRQITSGEKPPGPLLGDYPADEPSSGSGSDPGPEPEPDADRLR